MKKQSKKIFYLIISLLGIMPIVRAEASPLKLWYLQPANEWMKALPVGNGRLGAMIYGGIGTERIAMNEITMWSGQPDADQEESCGKEKLAEMRKLFFEGKFLEGNQLATQFLTGKPHSFGTHLPVGDLKLKFDYDTTKIVDYKRELDLRNAVSSVTFKIGKTTYKREYFCSNPDQVLVIRLSSTAKGSVSFNLGLDLLRKAVVSTTHHQLTFSGKALFPNGGAGGVDFTGNIHVSLKGGTLQNTTNSLIIDQADEAVITMDIRTGYKSPDFESICRQDVQHATAKPYTDLKNAHIKDYKALFNRVELFLGQNEADLLPTDVRWALKRQHKEDPSFDALFFQYGRYLLISSSRENSPLPANLQGLWNDNLACNMGWNCDYHLDINTEQNYWAANVTNLPECNMPLFNYIQDLSISGEKTAKKVYGSPGWVAHTVANVWGYSAPGGGVSWGLFPTAGAWMATQLWSHYEYTRDVNYLKEKAYPILKNTAVFFMDYMVENPHNGYLMTGPSNSPENTFKYEGNELALSMMPTCDRIIVYEILHACIESAKILNTDAAFRESLEKAIKKLPPLMIGKNGEVQEWFTDVESAHLNHRHTSHLLSIYPYSQITLQRTPELAEAGKKTIVNKLNAPGWEDVEFSRANMINLYARLKEPVKAYESVSMLLSDFMRENMLTMSPKGIAGAPYDIFIFDGNEAGAAGIAEMLVQNHEGYIEFLPSLPGQWKTGSFKGLCVKGGATVDLNWKNSVVTNAMIHATADQYVSVKLPFDASKAQIKLNGKSVKIESAKELFSVNLKKGDRIEITMK
ncbi:MAG: glycoside hydrolase family 95 protein [Paludibacter sp.]|nr:glycoside hydrolase family 95 protein [Paludibacter sp.]